MVAWWIGNIVYLVVIVPVVLVLLTRMLRAALEAKRHVDEIADRARSLTDHLGGLEELERTPNLARTAGAELERYGAELERLR